MGKRTPSAIIHPFRRELSDRHLPNKWTAEHVAARLIEAIDAIRAMPMRGIRPADRPSFWPEHRPEFGDFVGREGEGNSDLRPPRVVPSADTIGRMNEAISWPLHYLKDRPDVAKSVSNYALSKSCNLSMARIARADGMNAHTLRRRAAKGFEIIADGLNKDKVSVR